MLPGVRGTLVSEYFAEHLLGDRFAGRLGESARDAARKEIARIRRSAALLGPASSVRAVFDVSASRLVHALGFHVARLAPFRRCRARRTDETGALAARLEGAGAAIGALVVAWGQDLGAAWRDSIYVGMELDVRWCLLLNGRQLRLVDSWRSYGCDHLEFDLDGICDDAGSFALFWAIMRAEAFAARRVRAPSAARAATDPSDRPAGDHREPDASLVDEVVSLSAEHGIGVCRSLRLGVLDALAALMQGLADGAGLGSPTQPRPRDAARQTDEPVTVATQPPAALAAVFEQSLTIVYRILFLLFAEARRLVPAWHAVYRDAYSIETLRAAVEQGGAGDAVGLWETLQAISRLAHRGCRAGSLVVTPFNGRLFSPSRTPLGESGRLDDGVARQVLLALSTRHSGAGLNRTRIAYRDLGVEQLGAVYESVLDYQPRVEVWRGEADRENAVRSEPVEGRTGRPRLVVRLEGGSGRRKATGSFYTPQSLTGYLVRRTLHPLVEHATAEQILALRVLDPAMGSGAFLVAACQYLASRYEQALIAEGRLHPAEVGERDRALFRRSIAQRCLFGVDRNPMAVQLARLSLWLATLAADCPLTFLDHHLAVGDSLVGASLSDVLNCPSPAGAHVKRQETAQAALFDADELRADFERLLPERLRIGNEPGDTLAAVQDKERTIQRLAGRDGPGSRWKDVADLWCACWFWMAPNAPGRGVYQDVANALLGRPTTLPAASLRALTDHAHGVAAHRGFFHWQIEFPEAFFDASGALLSTAGFDAVIGNPPWDMLRADAGGNSPTPKRPRSERPTSDDSMAGRSGSGAGDEKEYDRMLARFARGSGFYTARSRGHPNRFQLFVERAFHLTKRRGRIGLVVPWGLFNDMGCTGLRRLLFGRADTDTIVGFDNARAVFPIHRSVRFALVTLTTEGPTSRTFCRFGEQDVDRLDTVPEDPAEPGGRAFYPFTLSPALLAQLSGDDLAVPDLRAPIDLEIVESVSSASPWLSARNGWNARFGRELNASDDRGHFLDKSRVRLKPDPAREPARSSGSAERLLPVLEGKHIEPFVAHVADARYLVPAGVARRLLARNPAFGRPRLAYRDVASATNRVTLIAAMLPADCVTTHTLFCLKTALDEDVQWFLCGVMNSYVANYLIRLRVTTHVSSGIIERLPVPLIGLDSPPAAAIVTISRQLAARLPRVCDDRLQALVARLYGLTTAQFAHILDTFPLVDKLRRDGALVEFARLSE